MICLCCTTASTVEGIQINHCNAIPDTGIKTFSTHCTCLATPLFRINMEKCWEQLPSRVDVDEPERSEDDRQDDEGNLDGEGELEYEDVLKLATLLIIEPFKCIISHGGNVYHMWDRDDPETARTLTPVAERKGVMDIWSAA